MRRNNDIRKDDSVILKWDIARMSPEEKIIDWQLGPWGDEVPVFEYFSYAREGDTGKVIEVFTPRGSKANTTKYAKVVMDDGSGCKTFKLTSLKREN